MMVPSPAAAHLTCVTRLRAVFLPQAADWQALHGRTMELAARSAVPTEIIAMTEAA